MHKPQNENKGIQNEKNSLSSQRHNNVIHIYPPSSQIHIGILLNSEPNILILCFHQMINRAVKIITYYSKCSSAGWRSPGQYLATFKRTCVAREETRVENMPSKHPNSCAISPDPAPNLWQLRNSTF